MKIIRQLLKEFWLPLFLAISWVIYNIYGNESSTTWNVKNIINIFGPTFFLLSWLTGQFFRVKKQTKVEDSFGTMETRFNELLNEFKLKTDDMIDHISGGNSFPYIMIASVNSEINMGRLMVIHNGEHPLYDVNVRIVDLNKFSTIQENITLESMSTCESNIVIGNLTPSHASVLQNWKIDGVNEQSYNVFFTARNGGFTQLIRMKKIDGTWLTATKVSDRQNNILHEQIDQNYPKNISNEVDWEST
jgi:hypothetical protein